MFFLFFFFYFCLREYLDLVAEQKVLQFDADASVSPSIFFFFYANVVSIRRNALRETDARCYDCRIISGFPFLSATKPS